MGGTHLAPPATSQDGRKRRLGSVMRFIHFILIILPWISGIESQLLQSDNRCFLEDGGSTLTFFIKEDLAVGQQIGRLNVQGRVGRDIDLKLAAISGGGTLPVELEGEDLVLAAPLDKEGVTGVDTILVDVLCERQRSTDPSFTIPVHVRVTDVNDNAPLFIGAPYNLSLSENTVVGSRILTLTTTDADQPGPFSTVEYSVFEGPFADYVTFENPLEGNLVLTKSLDYETMRSFTLTIQAKDQGAPAQSSRTLVSVNVIDADDQNPAFLYERYDALLPPPALNQDEGHKLFVQPQDLRAFDKDLGISAPIYYTFSGEADEAKYFELNRNTGHIYVKSAIPSGEVMQPVTLVVKATQFDNPDRYTVTTLTVTRDGNIGSDLQFLQHKYEFRMLENVPLNSFIGTLLTNRPNDRRIKFTVTGLNDQEFSVSPKGDVILRKTVDFEITETYQFNVYISDGKRNDSASVNVTLLNINDWDPRFKYPQYEFYVNAEDAFRGHLVGKLEVHDGDKGDRVTLHLKGPYSRIFTVNNDGELAINDIGHLNSTEAHLVAVAKDSGIPPRQTSVSILVRFGEELLQEQFRHRNIRRNGEEDEKFTLTVVLGLLLTVFLVISLALVIYICKDKKKAKRLSPLNAPIRPQNLNPEVNGGGSPPNETRVWSNSHHRSEPDLYMVSGSTKSSSVTSLPGLSSSEVALNPLNPQSNNNRYNFVDHRPSSSIHQSGLPELSVTSSASNGHQALKDSLFGGTGTDLSRLQWPRNSIPRRVKKLSWEDEYDLGYDRDITTFTDPDVSVTPLELQLEPSTVGRAIYF